MARQATPKKAKEPIKIRFKELANGCKSIILDQYVGKGKRTRETLKMYLVPELTKADRVKNANTMAAANAIKAQRILELTDGKAGVMSAAAREGSRLLLADWMEYVAESDLTAQSRKGEARSESYAKMIGDTLRHVKEYARQKYRTDAVLLKDVDADFCNGFVAYLKTAKQFRRGRRANPDAAPKEPKAARPVAAGDEAAPTPLTASTKKVYRGALRFAMEQAKEQDPDPSTTLAEWIAQLAAAHKGEDRGKRLNAAARHLALFADEATPLAKVNAKFAAKFAEYLETATTLPKPGKLELTPRQLGKREQVAEGERPTISPKTARNYFVCFKMAIQQAVNRGEIKENPMSRQDVIPEPEGHRDFLTAEELKAMIATPCRNKLSQAAFLFACYCGLRWSDIETLEWQHLTFAKNGTATLNKTQVKTRRDVTVCIPKTALALLDRPAKPEPGERVFKDLPSYQATERTITRWAARAGIDKHVTFHTSRHTFATLMITQGADIYTTSKVLGHTNVKTTQIYADLVDEKRREAAAMLEDLELI